MKDELKKAIKTGMRTGDFRQAFKDAGGETACGTWGNALRQYNAAAVAAEAKAPQQPPPPPPELPPQPPSQTKKTPPAGAKGKAPAAGASASSSLLDTAYVASGRTRSHAVNTVASQSYGTGRVPRAGAASTSTAHNDAFLVGRTGALAPEPRRWPLGRRSVLHRSVGAALDPRDGTRTHAILRAPSPPSLHPVRGIRREGRLFADKSSANSWQRYITFVAKTQKDLSGGRTLRSTHWSIDVGRE